MKLAKKLLALGFFGQSDSQYPLELSPNLWINGRNANRKTLGLSALNPRSIASLTSDDNNQLAFTSSAYRQYVAFNGKCLYQHKGWLTHASKSAFNFLHNGSDWYVAFRFMPTEATDGLLSSILANNNGSNANTGISISYDDRAASSRTNAIVVTVSKGTNVISAIFQNAVTLKTWSTVELYYQSSDTRVYLVVNGTPISSVLRASAHGTGDATIDFNIFGLGTGTADGNRALIKHLFIKNSIPDTTQRAALRNYFLEGDETIGQSNPINVYLMGGQSNMEIGAPTPLVSYPALTGNQTSLISAYTSNTFSSLVNLETLVYPTNNKREAGTGFGPEMQFGFRASAAGQSVLIKAAQTGSALYSASGWLPPSGTNLVAALQAYQFCLADVRYELNRLPAIKGYLWSQGETDSGGNGGADPDYDTNFTALIKKIVDDLNATPYNHDTSQMKWVTARTHNNFVPARTFNSQVRADQQSVMENFLTSNPSYASKLLSTHWFSTDAYAMNVDTVHFAEAGMIDQGDDFADVLI